MQPLADTSVTPNQLTAVRLITGLAGAAGVATGTPYWMTMGAALFAVAMLFDRADGDLARITGRTSAFGHRLDLFADTLCNAMIFVALGIGMPASAYAGWSVAMGVLAGIAVTVVLAAVVRVEAAQGARAGELGGAAGFDPDDAMLLVPLAIMLGFSHGLLLAASIGAPLFALAYLWGFRKPLFARASE